MNALFRFPTTSGWFLPETTLCFLTQGSYAPPSIIQSVSVSSLSLFRWQILHFPVNLHTLPLFSPLYLTFPLRSRSQRISAACHFPSFTQLHTEITPEIRILHPPCLLCGSSHLVVFVSSTVAFVLPCIPCFFACQFSRNYPRHFFHGEHSYIVDLRFRITNCRFLHAILFRTWGLVCMNLSFVSKILAIISIEFEISRGLKLGQNSEELC